MAATLTVADESPKRGRLALVGLTLVSALALSACEGARDMDWDLRGAGFSTADAARNTASNRPQPDSRGVISYPGYQVAVAQRGETVRQLAQRLGQDANELARQNAIDVEAPLRGGELMVLPGRVSEMGSGSSLGSGSITSSTLEPLAPSSSGSVVTSGAEPIRHTVQRGETAFTIARLYNVTARSLAEWNGLPADMSVREGQVMIIPVPQPLSQASAGATPTTPTPAVSSGPIVTPPSSTAQTPAPIVAAPTVTTTAPGQGSPTPVPPSASTPLPSSNPSPAGQGSSTPSSTGTTTPAPAAPVADMSSQRSERARLAMPTQGRIIRAYQRGRNDGIGIGAPAGTNVTAAAAGTVAAITRDTDQVPILVIRHDNNLLTVYANIDNIRVERGARVSAGQTIATVRAGDPSYLHFEVREGFDSVDPMPFLQ